MTANVWAISSLIHGLCFTHTKTTIGFTKMYLCFFFTVFLCEDFAQNVLKTVCKLCSHLQINLTSCFLQCSFILSFLILFYCEMHGFPNLCQLNTFWPIYTWSTLSKYLNNFSMFNLEKLLLFFHPLKYRTLPIYCYCIFFKLTFNLLH